MSIKPQRAGRCKSIETEVKIEVANLPEVRTRLIGLGFQIQTPRAFEDNWIFDFPDRSLAQRRQLLRIRAFNGRAWITFKTPSRRSAHFKVRQELETELGDALVAQELLRNLGLRPSFRYQKFRTVLQPKRSSRRNLVVTLDETPIGDFVEIEGSPQEIRTLAAQLGHRPSCFIQDSYWQLYQKRRVASSRVSMTFRKR